MSNRTDFDNVAEELRDHFFSEDEREVPTGFRDRIKDALHDAFVAGQESENKRLRDALIRIRDHRWESRAYADEAYAEVQDIAHEALKP